MNPLVSVIIPTYKSKATLSRAIQSVLKQTYENVEIIVVDDNNPDTPERLSTQLMMNGFNDESRVKYIQHECNKNGAAARNTGFRSSSGKYISFLDDDDYYLPEKIEQQVNFMENHPEYAGSYCWVNFRGKQVKGTYSGDLSKEILSLTFSPTTPALMVTRKCYEELGGFNESYLRHQDFEFLLRFFKKYSIGYIPSLQVVISNNGVNNTPKGEKLVALKEYFFSQFKEEIDWFKNNDKKTWKKIYLRHYVPVYKDLIRYGYPLLATRIYFKYGINQGWIFWRYFNKLCLSGMKQRLHCIFKY